MVNSLAIMELIRKKINREFRRNLKRLEITPNQAAMLRHVSVRGSCSLADISRTNVTDPASVNRLVKSLVNQGLIQKNDHASDHRCWQISLSEKGRQVASEISHIYANVDDFMISPLTMEERNIFSALLVKVLAAMRSPKKGLVKRKLSESESAVSISGVNSSS